jgi:hypothetical protein
MTTMVSVGPCWQIRSRTSRNRPRGSSTTGIRTVVPMSCGCTHGRYRRDRTTLTAQDVHTSAAAMENRYSWDGSPETYSRIWSRKMNTRCGTP